MGLTPGGRPLARKHSRRGVVGNRTRRRSQACERAGGVAPARMTVWPAASAWRYRRHQRCRPRRQIRTERHMTSESFFHQLFGSIADGGRVLIDRQLRGLARQPGTRRRRPLPCAPLAARRGIGRSARARGPARLWRPRRRRPDRLLPASGRRVRHRAGRDRARRRCLSAGAGHGAPDRSGPRRRGAAPGAVPAPQHGAGRHRGARRACAEMLLEQIPEQPVLARDRRRSPAPVRAPGSTAAS